MREIQRLRSEDRQAHDATFSAVAADVSRLKFGQAQLVKAHKQYQANSSAETITAFNVLQFLCAKNALQASPPSCLDL